MTDTMEIVYNFIRTYVEANTLPPTLDEIAQGCGLSGRSHAAYWCTKLRDAGLVTWHPARPRTLKIVGAENTPVAGEPGPQTVGAVPPAQVGAVPRTAQREMDL
jgi:SOS-response transcriptional repressor LexA